jgi:hypothetical protein
LLERPRSATQLSAALREEFEVDAETCLRDVCDFLGALHDAQLVRIQDETVAPANPPDGS